MSDKMNELHKRFKVAVRARDSGRYMYQIFTVAGEPRTFRSDSKSYATPDEAERAGYEAVAVLKGNRSNKNLPFAYEVLGRVRFTAARSSLS
jgi:hypothetical protein